MAPRAADRRASALARVREVAAARGLAGIVLTRPAAVAWAGAGLNPPIDRTAATDTVWLAIGPTDYTIITTKVEFPRVVSELAPADVPVVAVDWFDGAAFTHAAVEALGVRADQLGSDGHPDFGLDVSQDLVQIRLALSEAERLDLADLARDATTAVEGALRAWVPGETDFAIAARIAAACELVGADAPCLLVGGDSRLVNFRHPVACGDRPTSIVMAVLVARRGGLHVALTRYVAVEPPTAEWAQTLQATQQIHVKLLEALAPGTTFGDAMNVLSQAYAATGHGGEWAFHYQGGPIGYGQREFEIAPGQTDSMWWNVEIAPGMAVAYNPSLPGGFKDEDSYLIESDGSLRWLTASADWPTVTVAGRSRPDVLTLDRKDS